MVTFVAEKNAKSAEVNFIFTSFFLKRTTRKMLGAEPNIPNLKSADH